MSPVSGTSGWYTCRRHRHGAFTGLGEPPEGAPDLVLVAGARRQAQHRAGVRLGPAGAARLAPRSPTAGEAALPAAKQKAEEQTCGRME